MSDLSTRRCKCGCKITDDTTDGYWHGRWWFAAKAHYDSYVGRKFHLKHNPLGEQPEHDEQVRTGNYTLNRELLKRAHALEGTDRERVESMKRRWTPYDDSPASERAMREMCEERS